SCSTGSPSPDWASVSSPSSATTPSGGDSHERPHFRTTRLVLGLARSRAPRRAPRLGALAHRPPAPRPRLPAPRRPPHQREQPPPPLDRVYPTLSRPRRPPHRPGPTETRPHRD